MSRRQSKFIPQATQPNPRRSKNGRPASPEAKPQQKSQQKSQSRPALPFRPFETFEATYLGHPEGTGGFLRPAGVQKGQGLDLLVDWRDNSGAIHGDKVMAEISGESRDGRPRARIVKIVSRSQSPLPATLHKQPWGWNAEPLEPRMQQVIRIDPANLTGATPIAADGDLVSLKLDPNPELPQPKGTILARLGRPTDLKIENKLTAALYNLRTTFPDAVMDELAPFPTEIPEEWTKGREDLRELLTVTVDPPTAKDFDDAISLEVLPENEGGGWVLGVHIADVSHYVKENGPLDVEAHQRGTSVYFPDECIPMIPDRLSGDLCSLREGVDRLTMSAWMTISPDLEIIETRFSESVIRSRRRMTYDQVKEACLDLQPRARAEYGDEICEMLDQALVLSRRFTAARLGRGALNLDTEETEFVFSEDGLPVDARPYARHDAHRMIEEFMLLANEAVATFFSRKKLPTIYRIHDEPDPMKLEVFKTIASAFGLLRPQDIATPEVLNAMLDQIRGGPLEAMLNTLLLRSLKRAAYSADNIGHSGLALHDYLHFTSPIRRYPDLIVHRLLRRALRGQRFEDGLHAQLAITAKQCSDSEQLATEAERENDRWKTCLLMKPNIGKRFDGRIQGFSPKVVFIRLESPFVEVGVPLGALGESFEVDEHRTKATGMRGQIVLSIGDAVKVEITSVDENLRRVSAWIVEASAQDGKGKKTTFTPSLAAPITLREGDFVPERRGFPRADRPERSGSGRPKGRPPKAARGANASNRPKAKAPGRSAGKSGPSAAAPSRPGKPARTKLPKGSVRTRKG